MSAFSTAAFEPVVAVDAATTVDADANAAAEILKGGSLFNKEGRGAFIVLEGCDRMGKTTQAKALALALEAEGIPAVFMSSPDRSLKTGDLINQYLKKEIPEATAEWAQLLFAANRREAQATILKHLKAGTTVVMDRYILSARVYSISSGCDAIWIYELDRGLIRPDVTFLLDAPVEIVASRREGDAKEIFDGLDFQQRLRAGFELHRGLATVVIDANQLHVDIQIQLLYKTIRLFKSIQESEVNYLPVHLTHATLTE